MCAQGSAHPALPSPTPVSERPLAPEGPGGTSAPPARAQPLPTGWLLACWVGEGPSRCPLTRISSQLGNYVHRLPGHRYIIIIYYVY